MRIMNHYSYIPGVIINLHETAARCIELYVLGFNKITFSV